MGTYIDTDDIYERFGKANVDEWATLDDADSPTASTRIATAIAHAEQQVEDLFRNGEYEVPFEFIGNGQKIVDKWMATLAGIWLYNAHGRARGEEEKEDEMEGIGSDVMAEIDAYLLGSRKLDAERTFSGPTAPHG